MSKQVSPQRTVKNRGCYIFSKPVATCLIDYEQLEEPQNLCVEKSFIIINTNLVNYCTNVISCIKKVGIEKDCDILWNIITDTLRKHILSNQKIIDNCCSQSLLSCNNGLDFDELYKIMEDIKNTRIYLQSKNAHSGGLHSRRRPKRNGTRVSRVVCSDKI